MSTVVSVGTTTNTAYNVNPDTSGSLAFATGASQTTAMTLDTNQNAIHVGSVSAPNTFGFKNRIINGAMMIDQRNAGASVTPTNGQYLVDRWVAYLTQASKFTAQQNAGSVTPPAGFTSYQGVTSSSSYSVISTDQFQIGQAIEGFNVSDFGWGTANAQTITVSFWVRSSLTGTFGGSIRNDAVNRSYCFSYTISSANTWTQISVTIAGDTSGTWLTNNGRGLLIVWGLGSGSTVTTTAGSWQAGNYVQPTGSVSVVGTSGATFYITGVQLEKGTTATSFDYRPYGTELNLCQRYYQQFNSAPLISGFATSSTTVYEDFPLGTNMRIAPTATIGSVTYGGSASLYAINATYVDHFRLSLQTASGPTYGFGYGSVLTLSSEL